MNETEKNKPMTVEDIHNVLIPAIEERFATKKDLEGFRVSFYNDLAATLKEDFVNKKDFAQFFEEFREFKNDMYGFEDKTLKNFDILFTEKEVGNYQKQKERKLWRVMIDAMKNHNILTPQELNFINGLEIF